MISFFKRIFARVVTCVVVLIGKAIGQVRFLWTRKKITDYDVRMAIKLIKKGDVILTRTMGELTTICIPGFWKHAAVYVEDVDEDRENEIIEGHSPCARERLLYGFLYQTDHFVILRIKKDIILEVENYYSYDEVISRFVNNAHLCNGIEYDFSHDLSQKVKMDCSAIVYHSANEAVGRQIIYPRERMGFQTYTPQDIYNHANLWDIVYISEAASGQPRLKDK